MLGHPLYKREQQVTFQTEIDGDIRLIDGVIYVVDAEGTAEQQEEPSYDIEAFFEGEVTLFKHIRESKVFERGAVPNDEEEATEDDTQEAADESDADEDEQTANEDADSETEENDDPFDLEEKIREMYREWERVTDDHEDLKERSVELGREIGDKVGKGIGRGIHVGRKITDEFGKVLFTGIGVGIGIGLGIGMGVGDGIKNEVKKYRDSKDCADDVPAEPKTEVEDEDAKDDLEEVNSDKADFNEDEE